MAVEFGHIPSQEVLLWNGSPQYTSMVRWRAFKT